MKNPGKTKRRKALILAVTVVFLSILFIWWSFFRAGSRTDPISRALAARQTAFALAGKEEIEKTLEEDGGAWFSEEEKGSWFVPYASYLYIRGLWERERIPADGSSMGEPLTMGELFSMVEWAQFNEEEKREIFGENPENRVKKEGRNSVAREEWKKFYDLFLKKFDPNGAVTEKEILLIGTPNTLDGAGAWEAYTDSGVYSFEGLSLDALSDRRLKVKVRDSELLLIEEILSGENIYENVWLDGEEAGILKVYLYGTWRNFPSEGLSGDLKGMVADLHMRDGKIVKIALKKETIHGKLQSVSDGEMEIEGYGKVPVAENFRVYQTFGEWKEVTRETLLVGYDQAEFVVAEGKICAALIGRQVQAKTIRVLLTDAAAGSVFHEAVTVKADKPFTVAGPEEESVKNYGAGETVTFTPDSEWFSGGRLRISTESGGKIGFTSFKRKYGEPWYEGTMELVSSEKGILIINEVDLETYLCYVVPSEMPESYGLEALKAQAVCARSYACKQIEGGAYSSYGAHVDDTTTFQVYNNTLTDDLTRQAVKETEGQVITYGGNPVTAYYYATSCGCGNDMEVWGSRQEKYPYLKSIHMGEGELPDLSSEEGFRTYLEDGDPGNLEETSPWYRWETEIPAGKMTERMNRFLEGYAKSHTEQVLFKDTDGNFAPNRAGEGPETIGTVTRLEVKERSQSGFVNELLAEGTEGAVMILRPGTVRALLGDREFVYTRKNGTTSTGKAILPSASIVIDEMKDGETAAGFKIKGGGYGHGVGMSQTAAKSLAGQGKTYAEILRYFYPGTETANAY